MGFLTPSRYPNLCISERTIAWASKSHAITKLFDTVIGKILG